MLAVLTLALVLVGCSNGDAVRHEDGTVTAGNTSVFTLQVGDCLAPESDRGGTVSEMPLVPCEEPHTQEVYAIVRHPDEVYPGVTKVAEFANEACLDELQTFGLSLDDGLFYSYLLPTFEGWNDGGETPDRSVVCVLVFPLTDGMTGSVVADPGIVERATPVLPRDPDPGTDVDDDGTSAAGGDAVGSDASKGGA